MFSTSLYFLSRELTKKKFQSYFDRLDNTYTGFTRSIGYSIRLFNWSWLKTIEGPNPVRKCVREPIQLAPESMQLTLEPHC